METNTSTYDAWDSSTWTYHLCSLCRGHQDGPPASQMGYFALCQECAEMLKGCLELEKTPGLKVYHWPMVDMLAQHACGEAIAVADNLAEAIALVKAAMLSQEGAVLAGRVAEELENETPFISLAKDKYAAVHWGSA